LNFRGDHGLVAPPAQGCANVALGLAATVRDRRVDEVDAAVERGMDDLGRGSSVDAGRPEGVTAEPKYRHL